MARDTLTPKQEAFARAYVETGNASEAYRKAYSTKNMKPESIWVKASELKDNGNVSVRIAELQSELAANHDITLKRLTEMALEAYELAKAEDAGASSMVRAVAQLSKMHGFDAKERENDRMGVGDALAMIEARRKEAEADAGTVH